MQPTEQTLRDIERALGKIAAKFPPCEDSLPFTDIHLQVRQDSGELLAFNDSDEELNRCVIEQWIDNKDESFYQDVEQVLKSVMEKNKDKLDNLGILKPYSFVLIDEDRETLAELRLVDDEIVILGEELMKDLDADLNNFLKHLLDE